MATNNNTDAITTLKKAYDESANRLRVDPGQADVSICYTEDSIAVWGTDGTTPRQLKTNTAGELINPTKIFSTATVTPITAATSATTLLASNANRKTYTLFNNSDAICYILYASGASSTSFNLKMFPYSFYEASEPIYTGIITAAWESATGDMKVMEGT